MTRHRMWTPQAAVDEGLTCAYRFALSLLAGSGSAVQGFNQTPLVTNGYSDLINELYVPKQERTPDRPSA